MVSWRKSHSRNDVRGSVYVGDAEVEEAGTER